MSGIFFPIALIIVAIGIVHESKSLLEVKVPVSFKEISIARVDF